MKPASELLCVVLTVMVLGQAASDPFCVPYPQDTQAAAVTGTPPPKPTLPQAYTSRVEINRLGANITYDMIVQFDHTNNMAGILLTKAGVRTKIIYNYNTDELFTITLGTINICSIQPISTSRYRFLFGWKKTQAGGMAGTTFTPEDVFRFGGSHKAMYLGETVIRNLPTYSWESCETVKIGTTTATAKLTWSFLDTTKWSGAFGAGVPTVPVRARVEGVMTGPGGTFDFVHQYEFTEFQGSAPDPTMYHTMPGTVCANRKATQPVPKLQNFFKFEAEMVSKGNAISNIKEWYDSDSKLFRFDMIMPNANPSLSVITSRIDDYNVGVTYLIDRIQGTCQAQNLTAGGDVSSDDTKQIRIKNPVEFMRLDPKDYRYAGKRQSRGIPMDVWSGMKVDSPGPGINTTTEWYFAQDNGYTEYTTNDILKTLPKVFVYTVYGQNDMLTRSTWNIHNYELARPQVWAFDFSICFSSKQKKHLQFQLAAADYKTVVMQSESLFKYAVMNSIATSAGISTLRVSQIQVDYLPNSIFVTFTLLDQEPLGTVTGRAQTSLKAAAKLIQTAMQTGQLKISVDKIGVKDDSAKWVMTPTADSYKELMSRNHLYYYLQAQSTDGYSPGAMAGLGVAMIILGLLAGAAVMYFVYKRGGGAFPSSFGVVRFSNQAGDDDKETLPKD